MSGINDRKKIEIDLEHRKLLSEYNALLIALATVTLGIAGLIYTLTKDSFLSIFSLTFTYLIIDNLRQEKSKELDFKVQELPLF